MLSPKKVKYRKAFKGRIKGVATSGTSLNFGTYGMKAIEPSRITARQIESARRAITRHLRRQGKVWIRLFPAIPATAKPAEVRMGSGKGSLDYWYVRVHPGHVMFEIDGVSQELAREAFRLASAKLPIKTKFITRIGGEEAA